MGDKGVERLCHIGVLKANYFLHLYNTTPSPLLNVGFLVSLLFLTLNLPLSYTTLTRGRGAGSQSKPDLKWDK